MTELLCLDRELVPTERELSQLVQIKRFAERWAGDAEFREQWLAHPDEAVARYGLKVDPNEVGFLWNPEGLAGAQGEEVAVPAIFRRVAEMLNGYRELAKAKVKTFKTSLSDRRFTAWRMRNRARSISQLEWFNEQIGYFPLTFELTKGCSVGCWFCCVSALRLSNIFHYTPENAQLWQQILELMKYKLGSGAAEAFCYWATDPLDNPDYEKFCLDFYKILGEFPPTTTAQPLKDPARTRTLLKLSTEKGCTNIRFSVLSLKMLNQVHEEFTPEELAFVHLVLQNKEAVAPFKVDAGRARDRRKRDPQISSQIVDNTTNICVNGFLFNMVERSVKLISPCIPDDRWTLGYRIHDEGTFADINQLNQLLEEMISKHMPLSVRPGDLVRFRSDLRYESLNDGFQLSTRFKSFKFRQAPSLKQLGELITQGDKTAGEIAAVFEILGVAQAQTFQYLNQLFERGLLDDEPPAKDS